MIMLYVVLKGVVKMLICGMCVELVCYNIQVNGIVLGYFKMEMIKVLVEDEVFIFWLCKCMFVVCWGDFQEFIGVVVFFLLKVFDFVNGYLLFVDGGMLVVV